MTYSALLLFALAVGQDYASPLGAQERAELFAQWDRYEFPSTADAPAVRVRYWGGEVLGFLLAEEAEEPGEPGGARVLLTNLRELEGVEPSDGSSVRDPATYVRVDFAEEVWAYLDDLRGDRSRQRDWPGLPARAQLVFLARVCERRGHGELGDTLLAEAAAREEFLDSPRRRSLRERVRGDLERTFHTRAWLEATESRERYVGLANFARRFPESRYAAEAEHLMRVQERMIAEEPDVPSAEDVASLEGRALVDARVARLRTLRGDGFSINGGPSSFFAAESGEPPNEADRLVDLGEPALPALVAACDDDTLTWSSYPGRAGSCPTIVTVGECAQQILARITGERMRSGPAAWKVWWSRRHGDGEVTAAIDAILAGDPSSPEVARALAWTRPEDAVWAVELRIQESGNGWADIEQRLPWIEVYGAIDHPRVARFLAEEARTAGRLAHRVAAAVALERVDSAGALAATRRLAAHLHEEGHTSPDSGGRLARLCRAENDAARRLIEFLAERGAVDVLDAHYNRQRPHVRAMMAFAAAESGWRDLDRAPAAATRQLLGAALGDSDPIVDPRQGAAVARVVDPRVCDAAAFALARRAPERFPFHGARDESARDEQIRAIASALGR